MAGPLPAIVFWREGSASDYPRIYERLIRAGCAGGLCVPSVAALFLFVSDSTQRSVAGRPPALAGASSVVIFDCNGVLVDSEPLVAEVVSREFMRAGFALTPEIVARYFTGRRPADMFADVEIAAGRRLPPNFATVLTNEILKRFRADLRVTAHAAHALAWLRGPKCVASSSGIDRIRLSLETTGLLRFFEPFLFSASEVRHGKPAPDLFLHAAARMRVDARNCIVVEDSPVGVAAGVAAGMRVIGFAGGSHAGPAMLEQLRAAGANVVITDMRALKGTIIDLRGW
jgi:HAD superfamily hydrolase (TIGR01509 family)